MEVAVEDYHFTSSPLLKNNKRLQHKMSLASVFFIFALALASTYGERVTCREVNRGNGQLGFDCASVVPTSDLVAQNLYILWLRSGRAGQDSNVDIQIPNYQIQDVIQAAAKGGSAKSHTNINVNLARPETSYQAQKEERVGDLQQTFGVNLQYDRLGGRAVHFADDGANSERYSPLQGSVREP